MSSASKQQILAHIYRYLEENKLHEAAKALQAEIPSAVTAAKKVPKSALTVLAATSVADSSDDEPVRKPAPRKPSPKAAPKKAPIDSDSSDDEPVRKPAPRKPSPKSSPKAAPKKAPIDSDSSDDEPVAPPKKTARPANSDDSDDEPIRQVGRTEATNNFNAARGGDRGGFRGGDRGGFRGGRGGDRGGRGLGGAPQFGRPTPSLNMAQNNRIQFDSDDE